MHCIDMSAGYWCIFLEIRPYSSWLRVHISSRCNDLLFGIRASIPCIVSGINTTALKKVPQSD